MTGYVISPRAQEDIEEIWNYTADRWGVEQADRYVRSIQAAIETIAGDPRRGRSCDEVRGGYRKFAVGSHMLFFRLVSDQVDVVRVLHQQMDFERHL